METAAAAGLAVSVPGLVNLLLKTGLQGYEAVNCAQNADSDVADCLRGFQVEYRKLRDWESRTRHIHGKITLSGNGSSDGQERYRLIVTTLAQIACVFNTIAKMDGVCREGVSSSDELPAAINRRFLSVGFLMRRRKSQSASCSDMVSIDDDERPKSRQRSTSPAFAFSSMAESISTNMEIKELIASAEQFKLSVSSLSSLKWALLDKKRMDELYQKLRRYNDDLAQIVTPLLGPESEFYAEWMGVPQTDLPEVSVTKSIDRLFTIPFPQDPSFVERGDVLCQLDKLLTSQDGSQQRAALWGLGGTGKTTIAVEYCYRKAKLPVNILWVHGNSQATFKASYGGIAEAAKVEISGNEEESRLDAVKQWLESFQSGSWIMVIDNLDDLSLESKYIPARRGAVLFTTRDKRILGHPRLAVSAKAGVELQQMNSSEATMLCENLGLCENLDSTQSDALAELLTLLGNLPLAIAQAAAHIRNTGISALRYLELFKASADIQEKLLDKHLIPALKDELNTSRTVMRTWTVTSDKIRDENPLAIEILQFMSVLDPGQIPLQLAATYFKDIDELLFEESIGVLLSFALLSQLDSSRYRLHRLVSFWARRTTPKDRQAKIFEATSNALSSSFPDDQLADMSKCSQLLPHAMAVLHHTKRSNLQCDSVWNLQHNVASILVNQGQYGKALEWYQRALDGRKTVLGRCHHSTLDTVHGMAVVFDIQGQYEKAMEWYQRALDGREKVLGNDHSSTLDTVHGMAIVFDNQGQYKKALEWYQRALDGSKALGTDHPSTLYVVNNMALVFQKQGHYEKALEWYQRALDGREKALGKGHPSTLDTVHGMAVVFDSQGRYGKALEWYQRALDGSQKALGKGHPSTLYVINNMATVFRKQGQYLKALQSYQRALDGREKALGNAHPSTLDTIHGMAVVFDKQGQYEKALECYRRALDGREKALGKGHPSTLDAVHGMAVVFDNQGHYEKALEWYHRALDGSEIVLGKEHPSTLDTVHGIAIVLQKQGPSQYEAALVWYQRALDGREKALGKDHPSTLDAVHDMAVVFGSQGQHEKALEWYQRALDGRERALGKHHPSTLHAVSNMAIVYQKQGQYGKALEWYQRALDGREKALGKGHPSTLDAVHGMAVVFDTQGEYEKALEWYQQALDGREKTLGEHHPSTLDTVYNTAIACEKRRPSLPSAIEFFRWARDGYEKVYGKEHSYTVDAANGVQRLLDEQCKAP